MDRAPGGSCESQRCQPPWGKGPCQATNSPTTARAHALAIAGRGKSRRSAASCGVRGSATRESSVSVRTGLDEPPPAGVVCGSETDPTLWESGRTPLLRVDGMALAGETVPGGVPGGGILGGSGGHPPGGRPGGPRGAPPGGPGGPRGCTFWRVFNNSPSRDKMGHLFSARFLAPRGPQNTPPGDPPKIPPKIPPKRGFK